MHKNNKGPESHSQQPSSPGGSGTNQVFKPQSLKYVKPAGIKSDPLTFQQKNEPVPDLERKSSIGSEGSCFSKPNHLP